MKRYLFIAPILCLSQTSLAQSRLPASPLTGLSISYQSKSGQQCMSNQVPEGQVQSVLNQHGIKVNGPRSMKMEQGVATFADKVAKLGLSKELKGLNLYLYPDGRQKRGGKKSCASYTYPKRMDIVAGNGSCGRNINNMSMSLHLAHEFGHSFALQRNLYGSYAKVPRCAVTGYCTHNNNPNGKHREEFAEVFAMYVHSPQVLQSKCKDAYEFVKQAVGTQSSANTCKTNMAPELMGSFQPTDGGPSSPSSSRGPATGMYKGGTDSQAMALIPMLSPILLNNEEYQVEEGEDYNPTHGATEVIKADPQKPVAPNPAGGIQ